MAGVRQEGGGETARVPSMPLARLLYLSTTHFSLARPFYQLGLCAGRLVAQVSLPDISTGSTENAAHL